MNEKKSKRIRRELQHQYERAYYFWKKSEPPKILFRRWLKWKKSKPVLK